MDIVTSESKLTEYEDIVVVDNNGIIIYYDMANIRMFDLKPEEIIGKKVTSLYKNVDDDTSTIMKAVKTGVSTCDFKEKLITKKNNTVFQIGSTFTITDGEKIMGAIEFSKYLYTKDTINQIKNHAVHKIYRKNNTIYTIDDIKTSSSKIESIKEKIRKVGKTDSSVLICGSTGTGKEMVAQSIHNCSERRNQPFISLNCAAIPQNLLESTLFGTVKGSYTGAEDRMGLFEVADNGTLFLDEISSMEPIMQVKLLKAIEENQIRRVGGNKNIIIDVRIIAAINKDPKKLIDNGEFRSDLFFRLSVIQINLPRLKERPCDIEFLRKYFIDFYNEKLNMSINEIKPEVMDVFMNYDWPGNVRELKNIIEGAFNSTADNNIKLEDIPYRLFEVPVKESNFCDAESVGLTRYLQHCEREIIKHTIEKYEGNMSEAARQLKISRQLLKYKIEKYL